MNDALRKLADALVAWHRRCLNDEETEWNRRYDEAMQWRDWQTCDQLLEEREGRPWYRG